MVTRPTHRTPRRIFIDSTYSSCSGKNTGIERVVRSLLRAADQQANSNGLVKPQPMIAHDGQLIAIGPDEQRILDCVSQRNQDTLSTFSTPVRAALRTVAQVLPRNLSHLIVPEVGHSGVYKLLNRFAEERVREQAARSGQHIDPKADDLFLFPDAYWTRMEFWKAASKARAAGACIAVVIYDLIPLTHPEFVGQKRHNSFLTYLEQAIQNADVLVAISKTVQDELKRYIGKHYPEHVNRLSIQSFPLGAQIETLEGHVRPHVLECFRKQPGHDNPYLMVASFDPRKNHVHVLDAFEEVWRTRPDLKLCFVGRVGKTCQGIAKRIHEHPMFNRSLFAFHDLSDRELQHCYENARGVIFPSIVEGFGLPIVESLWYGRKTFASRTPIHLEVGGEDCDYFSLANTQELVTRIHTWEAAIRNGAPLKKPSKRCATWQDSYAGLMNTCLQTFAEQNSLAPMVQTHLQPTHRAA